MANVVIAVAQLLTPPIIRRLAVLNFPENRENNREFSKFSDYSSALTSSLPITIITELL
jgi:hypothetical protein